MMIKQSQYSLTAVMITVVLLSGCGGGGGGSSGTTSGSGGTTTPPASTFSISGTVSGLASGTQVVLLDNAGDAQTVTTNGSFTFDQKITQNDSYAVTVGTQPTAQTCTVNNGSGTNVSANISNVAVVCAENGFTISGTVSGLNPGESVTLLDNSADATKVTANGNFHFPTGVVKGGNVAVTIGTQPLAETCTITNGSATSITGNISNVAITCGLRTIVPLHIYAGNSTDGGGTSGGFTIGTDGNLYETTSDGGASGNGAVMKLTPAGVISMIYSFAGGTSDGATPLGRLIPGTDGNFYTLLSAGGADGFGAFVKVTTSGTESMLYSFAGGTGDGATPLGSLILGNDGNFYGCTSAGGTNGFGTVFKITPGGTETVLYSFAGGIHDGATPEGSLTLGPDGNFYGMTNSGGASGNGTVFKVTPSGVETMLYSFAGGTSDGANPVASLTLGTDGNFYGMTEGGGPAGGGVVFKVTPAGAETVLHTFAGSPNDGNGPIGSLTLGTDGNFYGMTSSGGAAGGQTGILFAITPTGVETILASFGQQSGGGGSGDVIFTSNGTLYASTYYFGTYDWGVVFKY